MPENRLTANLKQEVAVLRSRIRELEAELHKRAAEAPRPHADRYRALFEQSADAILIIAGDTFVDCNQATVDMLRYETKQELLETHPSELSPPTQPDGRSSYEKANEMIAIAFEKGSHRFEWDHKRADGEVFPVEVLLTPVPDDEDTKLHVVWRAITERKQLESRLRQAQKMEAIGKLAGGIAHDFNNLLVAINGNAELLQDVVGDDPEKLDLTRQIRWAGERAAELTRQLLAFSRKQVLQTRVLDLNEVIADIYKMLGRLIGEDINLATRPSRSPVLLKADPGQIEQVLINLTSNSRDAMPDGGTLTLSVEACRIEQGHLTGSLSLEPGDYVRLTVADTGIGMDEESQRRAFEPFFTTKGPGEGTGLGLATVYGIVTQSGGKVTLHSTPGEGTTVEVWFPATTEAPASDIPDPPDSDAGGNETILVVEDEGTVATLVCRLLQREGYTVLQCHNGLEALDLFEARHDDIDLILADVVMPRMGGPEMLRSLRERGHNPPVIFASGYSDGTGDSLEMLGGYAGFLQKPYTPRELLRSVRLALARASHPAKPDNK